VTYLRSYGLIAAAVVVAGAAFLIGPRWSSRSAEAKSNVKAEKDRKTAPDFALKDANGSTVHLSDYKGKVVLLNFWATWCGPCRVEIPWFLQFEREYKDRGFAVVGVSMDDDGWESVKPYIAEEKINYRILLGNESVSDLYGGLDSLPTTFLIDRSGRVAAIHIGLIGRSTYQDEISHLLDSTVRASLGGGAMRAE
jgi:cytochrome c biogenesis protein CcmG/thiol:disulfide interchange protein DsbE